MTAWTLAHTCDVNPGGIKEPVSLSVLTVDGGGPQAQLLSDEEMDEHDGMVRQAETYLADFPTWLNQKDVAEVPDVSVD